ncbi:hypothetical protein [Streptomyces sp. NPDC055210]
MDVYMTWVRIFTKSSGFTGQLTPTPWIAAVRRHVVKVPQLVEKADRSVPKTSLVVNVPQPEPAG